MATLLVQGRWGGLKVHCSDNQMLSLCHIQETTNKLPSLTDIQTVAKAILYCLYMSMGSVQCIRSDQEVLVIQAEPL